MNSVCYVVGFHISFSVAAPIQNDFKELLCGNQRSEMCCVMESMLSRRCHNFSNYSRTGQIKITYVDIRSYLKDSLRVQGTWEQTAHWNCEIQYCYSSQERNYPHAPPQILLIKYCSFKGEYKTSGGKILILKHFRVSKPLPRNRVTVSIQLIKLIPCFIF